MRSALSMLEVVRPRDLESALRALARPGKKERPVPIAGGTDLFVYLNAGEFPKTRFLDLMSLRSLRGVRSTHQGVSLGALTTFSEIREHAGLRRRLPSLVQAAAVLGGRQNQNRATLAGNIANASPAGDSLPVLLALEASVRLQSSTAKREVAFDELYRGYRDINMDADELITAVTIPMPRPRTFQFFRKVGTRLAQSISKVVFGGVLRLDSKGRVDHVRIAYGSVAPVPLRVRKTEEILLGEKPSRSLARKAGFALSKEIEPIDDIRSDREYRLTVAENVLLQFLRAADSRFA